MSEVSLREIVPVGIWGASAVAVAGYTWSAFKKNYSQFPGMGGGFGGVGPFASQGQANIYSAGAGLPTGTPKADKAGSFTVTPAGDMSGTSILDKIANPVLGFLGLGQLGDSHSVPTKNTPRRAQDAAIRKAVQSGNRNQSIALINQLWRQQAKFGWTKVDFQTWIVSRSWGDDFIKLASGKK